MLRWSILEHLLTRKKDHPAIDIPA